MSLPFVNLWMLAALAAAFLPLVIEWLFRRRKRQVELPTIRFLLDSKEQEKVRRQDRLLLLLRTLAIVLLVLALSRPLLRHGWVGGSGQRHVVVLLDGTSSMQQQVDVSTAFRLAQKKAAAMIRGLPEGTSVTVAQLGERVQPVVEAETDLFTAAAKVEALRASSGAAPASTGLSWIGEFVENRKLPAAEVYVFSDFQRYTWARPGGDAAVTSGALAKLGGSHEVFLVDVGGSPEFNFLVTSLRPSEYLLSAGIPVAFQTTIETRGSVPDDTRATVTFLVNGVKKDVREVAVGTEPISLEFQYRFPGADEYLVETVVEGDDHAIDNRRGYLCHVPEDARVLILDETAESPKPKSTYLARAIQPPTHPGMEKLTHFSVNTIVPAKLSYENLDQYAVVILTASSRLSESIAGPLKRYVADGGSLWMFMGEEINLYDYNRLLFDEGKGVLPCRLVAKVAAQDEAAAEGIFPRYGETAHPALAQLARSSGSQEAEVLRYVSFDVTETPNDAGKMNVVVALSNAVPMIVERRFGRGRALLSNTTAGIEWTHLPALPEFTILAQELLRYLVGNPNADVNLDVGDRFEQSVFVSMQHLLLRAPDDTKHRLTPRKVAGSQDEYRIVFDGTTQHGVYRIEAIEEVLPRRRFVVNPNPAEGDLARLDRDGFADAFAGSDWRWLGEETSVADFASKLHTITELAPSIIWALALLLAVESLLAWRFGRRRGEAIA